jgi:hypothetical protein
MTISHDIQQILTDDRHKQNNAQGLTVPINSFREAVDHLGKMLDLVDRQNKQIAILRLKVTVLTVTTVTGCALALIAGLYR